MYSYRWELFAGHNSGLFGTWKCGISAVYESHGPVLSFKSAFASTPCWMLLLSWGAGWAGFGGFQWLWEDIYGLTWLILQSACNLLWVGVFRKKGEGTSESHAFKAFKFCIPKETAIWKPFYMHSRYISLRFFFLFPSSRLISALANGSDAWETLSASFLSCLYGFAILVLELLKGERLRCTFYA